MSKIWITVMILSVTLSCTGQKNENASTSQSKNSALEEPAKSQKMKQVENGEIAPIGRLYSTDSTLIQTDSFKGKFLVIDFWATWCSPCLAEKPAFDSLKNNLKDEPITFISVSVNDDFSFWRDYLKQNNWTSNNYWMGNAESQPFFSFVYSEIDYKGVPTVLIGLPKYVIIAPDGNIINNNAPKPVTPELEKEIRKALGLKPKTD